MSWYILYLSGVLLLWVFSSPKDKMALRVILVAGVASHLMTLGLRWTHAPWKLIFPATVETLTIIALLHWSKNRTGYMQAGLLVIAWGAHALCFFDLITDSNLVYDNYSRILGWVAVGQLLACYDTLWHNLASLRNAWVRGHRANLVPASSLRSGLLQPKGRMGL